MFDYKFVSIKAKGIWPLNFEKDYKEIIQDHAREGWRFVQVVPLKWSAYGKPQKVEIVLERPTGWEPDEQMKTI